MAAFLVMFISLLTKMLIYAILFNYVGNQE